MDNSKITNQYDEIGEKYISGQNSFFNEREDWGRKKLDMFSGGVAGKVIIDAGCGHGVDTKKYLEVNPEKILSFDPSETMLSKARENVTSEKVIFKKGSYESIPFEDSSADVLIGRFSLHYVFDIDEAYKEIIRALKAGGKMSFLVPHPYDDFSRRVSKTDGQEIISISLYAGIVEVKYPSHTFSDYFSTYFLEHFTLDGFAEFTPEEMDQKSFPTALVFSATKK